MHISGPKNENVQLNISELELPLTGKLHLVQEQVTPNQPYLVLEQPHHGCQTANLIKEKWKILR